MKAKSQMEKREYHVSHFNEVDKDNIKAFFSADKKKHRISLEIPFLNRSVNKSLCIIGQNPSVADKERADPTIRSLEKYVYHKLQQYSKIIMLNLYTRVDTNKDYLDDLIRDEFQEEIDEIIKNNSDFLIVWGKFENDKIYNFIEKAIALKPKLNNKNVFKIDLNNGSKFAPHPLNREIKKSRVFLPLTFYNFEDVT